jgi:hypothetical protein
LFVVESTTAAQMGDVVRLGGLIHVFVFQKKQDPV